ncbi:glycoside hydrolase [Cyanobacterium stanieri LEGE 03274]|uniref:Glycoside hydrolase n=1 Tax=Cyanobacterium stanieri LEGE 03274 TaxID=1828756 RepID=A0ABR9V2V7_9CHRO|nr:glycoside hydrolase [Cyanobacterium stanieri]MBE9222212.1 glycoside hydrolase [Cyanobacterium stanieri LEGE 03274]
MAHPLYVAFIWHQHQPLYKSRLSKDSLGADYRLPWVRLHGIKDYLDLILMLKKYPALHQTVNLVPSLIMQLEDYAHGDALDPYLALTLTPVSMLTLEQKGFIVDNFFDANHYHMIRPHGRYEELFQHKHIKGKQWCLDNWTDQDLSDLLAWHNLAWFDPLFWDDADIARWLEKGRDFTLSDRQRIYSKQKEIIARIIPEHKKMQDEGQLEVTTTPYTHPILPLLNDTNAGRVALPHMELPVSRFQWGEDVPRHLHRAWTMYQERFGRSPRGLWPSEQSISPEILPHIAKEGFKWICSDEAVLGWSFNHFFHRDETGNVYEPEVLYRPYRLETDHRDLSIVFRDHRLSDLIGFTYGAMKPQQAACDLISHLQAIARTLADRQSSDNTTLDEPWLVTIALDGENCWEFYEQDGKPFLEELYQNLSHAHDIKLVTVSEFVEQFPPTHTIKNSQLHSGSWIDGNFSTWIGERTKNRAWDYLSAARQTLAKHPEATPENNPDAWEALYAAQGSDWFWWFGDPHHSSHDDMFDQLFREHLIALYQALNETVPQYLHRPVANPNQRSTGEQPPSSYISPLVDGKGDEQDWEKAGKIKIGSSRGTMHRTSLIPAIYYGWDHLNFYFRFDVKSGAVAGQDLPSELHLLWYYPHRPGHNSPIPLAHVPDQDPLNYHYRHHLGINLVTKTYWLQEAGSDLRWHSRYSSARIALDQCIEIAVPWQDLHLDPDQEINLIAILAEEGKFKEALPEEHLIRLQVP